LGHAERIHWNSAFQSPRRVISQWHCLHWWPQQTDFLFFFFFNFQFLNIFRLVFHLIYFAPKVCLCGFVMISPAAEVGRSVYNSSRAIHHSIKNKKRCYDSPPPPVRPYTCIQLDLRKWYFLYSHHFLYAARVMTNYQTSQ
jgi:hypothetical protein